MSSKLGRVLRGPHLAGIRVHRSREGKHLVERLRIRGDWEPIFTAEEHEALVAAAGYKRTAHVRRHMLTGLLHCGLCGSAMRRKNTARFGGQYACYDCGRLVIKSETIEAHVASEVLDALDNDVVREAIAAATQDSSLRDLAAQLSEDRAALEQLSKDHYVHRLVSREVFMASAGELEQRIEAAERRLAARSPRGGVTIGRDVRTEWAGRDDAWRRAVLDLIVERIVLAPTPVRGRSSFDPSRVTIELREGLTG